MDKSSTKVMFSNKSDEWDTPQDFYDMLDEKYNFTLDPCASATSAKCPVFFTEDMDGLSRSWKGHTVFVNPPYSDVKGWAKKCYEESKEDDTMTVMLIPSRTDTKYFNDFVMLATKIYFVRGRLKFGNQKNCAPFPSMVVEFDGTREGPLVCETLERR